MRKLLYGLGVVVCILAICYANLTSLKNALTHSFLADIFVKIRDVRQFDPDHVVTKLDNGMLIVVNARDRTVCWLTRLTGHWDGSETAVLKNLVKPGFSVIEVGANFGVHTLPIAQLVGSDGHVTAFEANPHVSKYLKESVKLNQLENTITVHEKAAGDVLGSAYLTYGSENIGAGHLTKDSENTVKTEIVRLDDVLGDTHVDLLKMDTEGCEAKILEGAQRMITRNPKIIIMMEWFEEALIDQGSNPKILVDQLQRQGFNVWKVGPKVGAQPNLIPITFEALRTSGNGDLVLYRGDICDVSTFATACPSA